MKKNWLILCIFLAPAMAPAQFRVVGYLNTWDGFPQNAYTVPFDQITHLYIAFAEPLADGRLTEIPGLETVVGIAHRAHVKIFVSLGGADMAGSRRFWHRWSSPGRVSRFAANVAAYAQRYRLDGIDVDLEGRAISRAHYAGLVKALWEKLHPANRELTAAVATWFERSIPVAAFRWLDFVNIMSYDSTGPWKPMHPGQHASYAMAERDLKFWREKGLSPARTGLGVPFYGYGFREQSTRDELAYRDIVDSFSGVSELDQAGDNIFFNGLPTIRRKTALALHEAAGIMIWQLGSDASDDRSLLRAVHEVLEKNAK